MLRLNVMFNKNLQSRGQLAQGKNGPFVNSRFKGTGFDSHLRQDFFKRHNINSQFKLDNKVFEICGLIITKTYKRKSRLLSLSERVANNIKQPE